MRKTCKREIISKNLNKNYIVKWDSSEKTVWIETEYGLEMVGSNCNTEEIAIKCAQKFVDGQPHY